MSTPNANITNPSSGLSGVPTGAKGQKTLLLIRHAKSDWANASLSDYDRPLNERGKTDAPQMAARLVNKGIKPSLFISSPARRAKKTAEIFINELKLSEKNILFKTELYLAGDEVFFDVIGHIQNEPDCIAIFSHNPGITYFANMLTSVKVDNIPTCGIFAITINGGKWSDFINAKKEFLFFDYPKKQPY